ncbi:MAG: tetratricopeptide repeat protein [Nocardioidaceae bacterium]
MAGQMIDELARNAAERPGDGVAAFEYASALDAADREAEAIPVYRRALECELPDQIRYRASVQLGSSLRLVGESEQAVAVHRETLARWPKQPANRLFLALALLAAGRPAQAVSEAVATALIAEAEPDIDYYRRALTAYAQQLTSLD